MNFILLINVKLPAKFASNLTFIKKCAKGNVLDNDTRQLIQVSKFYFSDIYKQNIKCITTPGHIGPISHFLRILVQDYEACSNITQHARSMFYQLYM